MVFKMSAPQGGASEINLITHVSLFMVMQGSAGKKGARGLIGSPGVEVSITPTPKKSRHITSHTVFDMVTLGDLSGADWFTRTEGNEGLPRA